jgi:hypothetical protein
MAPTPATQARARRIRSLPAWNGFRLGARHATGVLRVPGTIVPPLLFVQNESNWIPGPFRGFYAAPDHQCHSIRSLRRRVPIYAKTTSASRSPCGRNAFRVSTISGTAR